MSHNLKERVYAYWMNRNQKIASGSVVGNTALSTRNDDEMQSVPFSEHIRNTASITTNRVADGSNCYNTDSDDDEDKKISAGPCFKETSDDDNDNNEEDYRNDSSYQASSDTSIENAIEEPTRSSPRTRKIYDDHSCGVPVQVASKSQEMEAKTSNLQAARLSGDESRSKDESNDDDEGNACDNEIDDDDTINRFYDDDEVELLYESHKESWNQMKDIVEQYKAKYTNNTSQLKSFRVLPYIVPGTKKMKINKSNSSYATTAFNETKTDFIHVVLVLEISRPVTDNEPDNEESPVNNSSRSVTVNATTITTSSHLESMDDESLGNSYGLPVDKRKSTGIKSKTIHDKRRNGNAKHKPQQPLPAVENPSKNSLPSKKNLKPRSIPSKDKKAKAKGAPVEPKSLEKSIEHKTVGKKRKRHDASLIATCVDKTINLHDTTPDSVDSNIVFPNESIASKKKKTTGNVSRLEQKSSQKRNSTQKNARRKRKGHTASVVITSADKTLQQHHTLPDSIGSSGVLQNEYKTKATLDGKQYKKTVTAMDHDTNGSVAALPTHHQSQRTSANNCSNNSRNDVTNGTNSHRNQSKRLNKDYSAHIPDWEYLWNILRYEFGWTCVRSPSSESLINPWWYLPPNGKYKNGARKNIHYFESKEDVMIYWKRKAKHHMGISPLMSTNNTKHSRTVATTTPATTTTTITTTNGLSNGDTGNNGVSNNIETTAESVKASDYTTIRRKKRRKNILTLRRNRNQHHDQPQATSV